MEYIILYFLTFFNGNLIYIIFAFEINRITLRLVFIFLEYIIPYFSTFSIGNLIYIIFALIVINRIIH